MKKRFGGKFGTSHSTMTDAGALIADIAARSSTITRVVHGPITAHRGSSGGSRRVKMSRDQFALKVQVTANASHQLLYVYSADLDAASEHIAAGARGKGFDVAVG